MKPISDPARDIFTSLIRIHILHHTAQRAWYGQELKDELEEHGYSLSYGTLYPILGRLHEAGLLEKKDQNVGGRIRKYYTITQEGLQLLEKTRIKIRILVGEILEETKE